MIFFLVLITLFYVILIAALLIGWRKIPEFKIKNIPPKIRFSVVIPFRNEAENLPLLLNSLSKLNYPTLKYEILLVNDASEDVSIQICDDFINSHPEIQISLLENKRSSNSPKKDAISTAIKNAQFEYIITTDADCKVPENWLQAFNERIIETGAKLVAGPVKIADTSKNIIRENRWLKYFHFFQEMDFMSLQAAGAGGFGLGKAFMCNGANLCYEKAAFLKADGFSGNDEISSGDDIFLLQKFTEKKWPVSFLKCAEAIVLTKPQQDLNTLISQRIRWAAKTPAYKSSFAKLVGLTVLLMNFSLVIGGLLAFFSLIPYQPLLFAFFFKFNVDFALLYHSAEFFDRKDVLRNYFWSSIIYPVFSSYVAILSLFSGYEWKGRKFRSQRYGESTKLEVKKKKKARAKKIEHREKYIRNRKSD
ncbi:MAG: glycosyltransferase [Flavobacteriaceae bacterium]|nr:glycosyltransferase [Flavobacteriaceae bacterium]